MTPDNNLPSPPADAVPEPSGFLSRLIGVYFSPGETFPGIGRAPNVLVPILVLALLSALGSVLAFQRLGVDKLVGQGIEQQLEAGKITPEQAETQREGIRRAAPYIKVGFPFVAAVASIVFCLAIAGIAKLVSMVMGVENNFLPLLAVTVYTLLAVSIVSSIVFLLLIYIRAPDEIDMRNPIGSNLGALLSIAGVTSLPKFVSALATYVDVFYIWKIVLLGIGYAAVSHRLKGSKAITYTAVIGVIVAVIGAGFAAMFT
jgi:Yip1 domain